jgi:catalase
MRKKLFCNLGSAPNYYRNTFHGPDVTNRDKHLEHATFESGLATRHEASEDDNYSQPRVFYQVKKKQKILFLFIFGF